VGVDPTGYAVWFLAPIGYYGGAALGLWGAAETGVAIGNAVNEISAGEKAAGAVILSAATIIAVDRATDLAGGKILRIADAVIPASAKQAVINAAESVGNKVGLGSADVPANGAENGNRRGTETPNEIGTASERRVVSQGEQNQMAVEGADKEAARLKFAGASEGAASASVTPDGTVTAGRSQRAAKGEEQPRNIDTDTGCRPTCGEGDVITNMRANSTPTEGAAMATVRIDGKQVTQPDGSEQFKPGKLDGNLMDACEGGCSNALEQAGMRDAVKELRLCDNKPCAP